MATDGGDPVLVNLLSPSSAAAHVTFGDTSSSQYQSQSQPQPPYVVTDYPDGIYMRSVSDSSISDGEPGEDEEDVSDGGKNEEHDQDTQGAQNDTSEDGEEKHDDESHQNATGSDSTRLLPLKWKPEVNSSVSPGTHDGAEKGNVVVEDSATVTTSPEPRIDLLHLIMNVSTGVSDGAKNKEHDRDAEGTQDDASEDGEEKHDNESHQNSTGNDSTRLLPLKRKLEVNSSVVPSTHDGAEKGNVVVEDSATATTSPEPRIDLLHLITNVFTGVPDRKKSEDVDILEIASRAGIHFDPPRWWRPGGYDMLKKDK